MSEPKNTQSEAALRKEISELTTAGEEHRREALRKLEGVERKHAEVCAALADSERKLLSLISSLPGMAYRCRNDKDWTMTFVSEGCRQLTGYAPEDLIENKVTSYNDIIHPEDRDMVAREVAKGLHRLGPFDLEYRIQTASGTIKWVWEQGGGVYDDGAEEPVALEGFILDMTERRYVRESLRRQNRARATVTAVNEAIVHIQDESELLETVCRIIVERGGYHVAWVGLAEDDPHKTIRIVAWEGCSEEKLDDLNFSWSENESGQCPAGTAIRSGHPSIMRQLDEPRFAAWKEIAKRCGVHAMAAFPLAVDGKTIGALSICSSQDDPFDAAEISLLQELASDLGFGIAAMRARREQRRAEAEIERLARFSQENPNPVLRVSLSGVVTDANPASKVLLACWGVEVGQALPEPWTGDLTHIAELGQHRELEMECAGRVYSLHCVPVVDAGYVNIYARDVTEHKQAEQAHRAAVERYRALFERSMDALYVHDFEGRFLDFNEPALKIFGYTREEAEQLKISDIVDESQLPLVRAALKEIRETGAMKSPTTFLMLHKDGHAVAMEVMATAIMEEGHPVAVQGIARDLTERMRAQEIIRLERDRAKQYLDLSRVMFVALNPDGTVQMANRTACEILGYSQKDVVGANWFEKFLPEHTREKVWDVFRKLMSGQVTSSEESIESAVLTRDGEERLIEWRNALLRDSHGRITGTLSSGHDITRRRRAEETLHQNQEQLGQVRKLEAIGRLAGGVAHDFNNILMAIMGYCDVIRDGLGEDHSLTGDVNQIADSANRAASLTRQLLAFSRKQVLEPKNINLNDVAAGIDGLLRRLIGEDIRLETYLADDLDTVRADPGQMEQVLMNLVINARDAMQSGGSLTIETANVVLDEDYLRNFPELEAGPYVMLAVSDTGSGMDADTLEKIFEPFFTTKGIDKGTGLGLATVYGVVKQSGGHIRVYSEKGIGTTFKVYLPRVSQKTAPVDAVNRPVPAEVGGSETVLVVEDDPSVRHLALRLLKAYGYNVLEASNGSDAIEVARKYNGDIHLVLTDVIMPEVSGPELIHQLEITRPDIRAIYMSGYTGDTIAQQGLEDSGVAFLQKPFDPTALLAKIRQVIDES